jgi:hypothetical protein
MIRLGVLILALSASLLARPAAAIEVTCIEASRYHHLFQIFGGDPKKFAAYLQVDPNKLPSPDLCRAALVSGPVDASEARDADKLVDFIIKNRGWLAALHLSSGGGKVGTGYQLGFLTRNFWLKTYTVSASGTTLIYTPDFFLPPVGAAAGSPPTQSPDASLEQGWQAYVAAMKNLPPQTVPVRGCISACGLIHAAGVERFGVVRVHRARFSGEGSFIDLSKSMTVTNEGLMRSEDLQVSFYRQMDVGGDFIRIYQATPPETTTPVDVTRYPRYVADYLNARCSADVGQLQRLERQFNQTIASLSAVLFGAPVKTDPLREVVRTLHEQRGKFEQCVATAHERERLAAFDKMCTGGCDRQKLLGTVETRIRDLAKAQR